MQWHGREGGDKHWRRKKRKEKKNAGRGHLFRRRPRANPSRHSFCPPHAFHAHTPRFSPPVDVAAMASNPGTPRPVVASQPGESKALDNRSEEWNEKWGLVHRAYILIWRSNLKEAADMLAESAKTHIWNAIAYTEVRNTAPEGRYQRFWTSSSRPSFFFLFFSFSFHQFPAHASPFLPFSPLFQLFVFSIRPCAFPPFHHSFAVRFYSIPLLSRLTPYPDTLNGLKYQ